MWTQRSFSLFDHPNTFSFLRVDWERWVLACPRPLAQMRFFRIKTGRGYSPGDGSIQMNIQELASAQYKINVKIVLFEHGYLGMVFASGRNLFYGETLFATRIMNLRSWTL